MTRGITIDGTRAEVWPWLVQLGADRGGFYTHDWLENLSGLGIHSADGIVDQWQHLAVGDVVHADRRRSGGRYVVELHPEDDAARRQVPGRGPVHSRSSAELRRHRRCLVRCEARALPVDAPCMLCS